MTATVLRADHALLPTGWCRDVAVTFGGDGRIAEVVAIAGASPPRHVTHNVDILLPAMGNLHSHSFQRAMAGLTESRTAGQDSFWTWRTLMYRFLDQLTPDEIEIIAAFAFLEMLEAGYGAVGEFHYLHHGPGGAAYDDLAELSARIAAGAGAAGIGLTLLPVLYARGGVEDQPLAGGQLRFGNDIDRFARLVEAAEALLPQVGPDAGMGIAAHSLRAVGVDDLGTASMLRRDRPMHIHIAEQQAEVSDVLATHGATPVRWLLEIMDVDPRWCLIHATHMTPAERRGLAETGAVAGLCPVTEANLGDGVFSVPDHLSAQGRFGVGTDSNVRISLTDELCTLEYGQRLTGQARAVIADDAQSTGRALYDRALAGGAQALGRASGQIAPGCWADLVALDGGHLALEGLAGDTLLDAWIFAADCRVITDVWSAGRHMVQEGRHIHRPRIEAAFRQVVRRLRAI